MANNPITREEMLLNAVAEGVSSDIKPITREEMYLAYIGGQDVTPPEPITRKEQFLSKIQPGGSGGGGDSADILHSVLARTVTEYSDAELTEIGDSAFASCPLVRLSLPNLKTAGKYAFNGVPYNADLQFELPELETLGDNCFLYFCASVYGPGSVTLNLPKVNTTGTNTFRTAHLRCLKIPEITELKNGFFSEAWVGTLITEKLTSIAAYAINVTSNEHFNLVMKGDTVVELKGSFAARNGCTAYVHEAQIPDYEQATNWSALVAAGTVTFVAVEGSEYE